MGSWGNVFGYYVEEVNGALSGEGLRANLQALDDHKWFN